MPTILNKTVKRKALNSKAPSGRSFVIELRAGSSDTIFIREEGRRLGYEVTLESIYKLGARQEADKAIKEKEQAKKTRREARSSKTL